MRRLAWLYALAAACALATGVLVPARAATSAVAADERVEPARVMVMLDLGAAHFRSGSYGGEYGDDMARQMRRRLAHRIARAHGLTVLEDWPMDLIGVDCVIMQIGDRRSPETVVRELTGTSGVSWSQPLNEFQMQAAAYNDKLLATQPVAARWHLARLHKISTGRGVSIGIVDSRIDAGHPDLAGQIASSADFVTGRPQAERHGTGVAGIIAARPNNAMGIVGVAPGARIFGLRACWERPLGGKTVCDSLSLAKALTFAISRHIDVINLSLSGPPDPLLAKLIGIAVARGVTVVVALDPARLDASFPASLPGVVPVGDERLSARAATVYIAPGVDIPTTEPEGKWSLVSGTSYAAAHVSGLAALVRQVAGSHRSVDSLLGPHGTIDACAAVGRFSRLDVAGCESSR